MDAIRYAPHPAMPASALSTRRPLNQPAGAGFTAGQWWLLAGITLLGIGLRAAHLGTWSLWVDEAFTWRDATMAFDGEGGFLKSDRALYPLAFLTVRALLQAGIGGPDEWLLRWPFAVVGALTVPVMALCGRRLVGPAAALLAAALLALDPWHVFWSQNARGYVWVVLAAALATNRVHAYAQQERVRDLVAAVLATALGVLAHGTAWLLLVGFVGFLLTRFLPDRKVTRQRLLLAGLVFVVALPWILAEFPLFPGFQKSKSDPSLLHFVQTSGFYFRPAILLTAVAALAVSRRLLDRARALLLGCCTVLPFLSLAIVSAELVKVTARYAICTLPAVTWLAAFGAVELTRRSWSGRRGGWAVRLAAAVVPLLLLAGHVFGTVQYHGDQFGQRARWREACEFVVARGRAQGNQGVRVVTINQSSALFYLRPWHWRNDDPDPYPTTDVIALSGSLAATGILNADKPELRQQLHEPGAINHLAWHLRVAAANRRHLSFLVTMPELAEQDPDGSLRRALTTRCELVAHFPCWVGPKDESIYVYEPKVD